MKLSILGNHCQNSNKAMKKKVKTKIEPICIISLFTALLMC